MISQESPPHNAAEMLNEDQTASRGAVRASRPNLLVIGAMKASTTTFYELITRHPEIWFSSEKEPHYFTSPDYGDANAWQRYLKLFEHAPGSAKYIGEASTGYSKLPHFGDTPARLRKDLEELRLIYLIRDPVERTISNYQHAYLSGHYETGTTLSQAIERDPILIDASCYARQIDAYREVFGEDALLNLTTNELHSQPMQVMRRVEAFLGVSAFEGWDLPLPQSNSRQALGRSLAIQALMPKPLLNAIRATLPTRLLTKLKALASRNIEVPKVTESERELAFGRVEEDLRKLQTIMGGAIDSWPSVQKLGKG